MHLMVVARCLDPWGLGVILWWYYTILSTEFLIKSLRISFILKYWTKPDPPFTTSKYFLCLFCLGTKTAKEQAERKEHEVCAHWLLLHTKGIHVLQSRNKKSGCVQRCEFHGQKMVYDEKNLDELNNFSQASDRTTNMRSLLESLEICKTK